MRRLAAAVAFYTLLSLSPLVILTVGIARLTFGEAAAGGQLAWEIHDVVGWDGATVIQAIIRSAHYPHAGILATVLSTIALVFGAYTCQGRSKNRPLGRRESRPLPRQLMVCLEGFAGAAGA